MSKPPILQGCDVLPPMHSTTLPNEANGLHQGQDQAQQSKTQETTEKPDRQKTADRFAVLNNFVDFTLAELIPSAGIVWLVLYRDTKPDGIARTSQADLARRTGLSDRTIRRAIEQLKAKELLQVLHQGGKWCGISTYRVHPLTPQ